MVASKSPAWTKNGPHRLDVLQSTNLDRLVRQNTSIHVMGREAIHLLSRPDIYGPGPRSRLVLVLSANGSLRQVSS
jgi:hypothetical protein